MDGLQVLKEIKSRWPKLPVIMVTGHEKAETVVEALRAGALDYLIKPISNEKLCQIVSHAVSRYALESELRAGHHAGSAFDKLVGKSQEMQKVRQWIEKVASHDINVLIQGETGTGKELVARALHDLSSRRNQSFVPVDCAAIPETLMESELFGYERGAFTGAVHTKPGKFQMADRGTLFLDEIGTLPLLIQSKLLRFLQERRMTRLGSTTEKAMDIRLIAATNFDLTRAIERGHYREDLFHRVSGVTIELPPLRERGTDIELLALHFLLQFNEQFHKEVTSISEEAVKLLHAYPWPGNVRELEHAIEGAVVFAEQTILPHHLPSKIQHRVEGRVDSSEGSLKEISRKLVELREYQLITSTLEEVGWNKSQAARKLQISYRTFFNKIKKYGIKSPELATRL